MRRIVATVTLGAGMVLGSASVAGATHTGCTHHTTTQAHASVPHHEHHEMGKGTHNAHSRIPYCPPEDAGGHGGH